MKDQPLKGALLLILGEGLLAVIVDVNHDKHPLSIAAAEFDCFVKMGLSAHLTPARNNGVYAVLSELKARADSV